MMLEKRSGLSRDDVYAKSLQICTRLFDFQGFNERRSVMAYMDFRNEVMTGDIIRFCLEKGKRILLPLVIKQKGYSREIAAYEVKDPVNDVERGAYGILEPDPCRTKRVEESQIDLVIIPGVAFDLDRYRIGYGAGYYDRFLRKLNDKCMKIGLAFDLQVLEKLPCEPHDIPVDVIMTESRMIL